MKRLLTAAAILGLVALMLPATAAIVLGQDPPTPPTISPVCSSPEGGQPPFLTFDVIDPAPDGLAWYAVATGTDPGDVQGWELDGTGTNGNTKGIGSGTFSVSFYLNEPGLDVGDNPALASDGGTFVSTVTGVVTGNCTGTLTFVKYINGQTPAETGPAHPDQFSFSYDGTNGEGSGIVTLPKGNYGNADSSIPITLPYGTYSVGEVVGYYATHGYSLLADVCGPVGATAVFTDSLVTLSADHPDMQCIFTN